MKLHYILKIIWTSISSSKFALVCNVLLNSLLTVCIISSGILYHSLSDYMTAQLQARISCRTILVNNYGKRQSIEELAETIHNINPHIIAVRHQDQAIFGGNISSMATNQMSGDVFLYGCDENIMPELTEQIPFSQSDLYCIVPERFYPDALETSRNENNYVDGHSLIGQNLLLSVAVDHYDGTRYYTIDHVEYTLLVVGTYDTVATFQDDNVCYVPFSLIGEMQEASMDDTIEDNPYDHPMFVYVDEIQAVNEVLTSLQKNGYYADVQTKMNENAPREIRRLTGMLCIALYAVTLLLSAILLLGMIRRSSVKIALLKSLGFDRKALLCLFMAGHGLLLIFGYFVGLMESAMFAFVLKNFVLARMHEFAKMQLICAPSTIMAALVALIMVPLLLLALTIYKIDRISPIQLWRLESRK